MKKQASEAVRKKILGLIRKGRVAFKSDPKLLSRKGIKKTSDQLIANPEFAEIGMDDAWKKWRRKPGRGNNGGFAIRWGVQGLGFGEIAVYLDKKNRLMIDSEHMGKNFVKKALCALVDSAKIV